MPVEAAVEHGDAIRLPFSKETVLEVPVPMVPTTPAMTECNALDAHYHRAA